MTGPKPGRHRVALEDARPMVQQARAARERSKSPWAWHFERSAFEELLATPGAAGIRLYAARGDDGRDTLVMVATDAGGSDLAASTIMDKADPCPPWCPEQSALTD